jgi:hypothetical protein
VACVSAPGGANRLQCRKNGFHDGFELAIHLCVCKTQDLISRASQVLVAHQVPLSICIKPMLISIDLNNHTRSPALEIDNVRQDRGLPPEMMA